MSDRKQTPSEEIANTISHGIGIVFCLVAMPQLIIQAQKTGDFYALWSVYIFGFGMLMIYSASTTYHAVSNFKLKKKLQVWDHISIFLMIAGSYTPFVTKFIPKNTAILFLVVMWSLVALGSILKIFFTGRFNVLSVIVYLCLGWMAVFILQPLIKNLPLDIWFWIIGSGLFYTAGTVFYLWHRLPFHHTVWHLFVLGGTVTHYIAIYKSMSVNVVL